MSKRSLRIIPYLILLVLLQATALESKSVESLEDGVIIPKKVACTFRGEEFFLFIADKVTEKRKGNVKEEKLDKLIQEVENSSMLIANPSWDELSELIVETYEIKTPYAEKVYERGLTFLFGPNSGNSRPKSVIKNFVNGKASPDMKYGKLTALKIAFDGKLKNLNVCEEDIKTIISNNGVITFNMDDYRKRYHYIWISDLYLWFKNNSPNIDRKLFSEVEKWNLLMPVFIEGAVGDKPDDALYSKEAVSILKTTRLNKLIEDYFRKKTIKWNAIDWSKSRKNSEGGVLEPSIVDEHTNFSAQFLGAVKLLHLMSRAKEKGVGLQAMAFSAGTNVLMMATEIYNGLGYAGEPFKNVILVQGSIYPERNYSILSKITSNKILITTNKNDSYYLGVGTRSPIGYSGGSELFGKGNSLGFKGPQNLKDDNKILVQEIYYQPESATTLFDTTFRDPRILDNTELEHWQWFSAYNFKKLLKVFDF